MGRSKVSLWTGLGEGRQIGEEDGSSSFRQESWLTSMCRFRLEKLRLRSSFRQYRFPKFSSRSLAASGDEQDLDLHRE